MQQDKPLAARLQSLPEDQRVAFFRTVEAMVNLGRQAEADELQPQSQEEIEKPGHQPGSVKEKDRGRISPSQQLYHG